jgi:hypothetical protein
MTNARFQLVLHPSITSSCSTGWKMTALEQNSLFIYPSWKLENPGYLLNEN